MGGEPQTEGVELSEVERARIRAEMRYALAAVAESRPKEAPKSRLATVLGYLSNGFVLLVLGSLVTAVLVPHFQRRYEARRQQAALMQECLEQFLLYGNSLWQEYYAVLPLTQRAEIDQATYLEYLQKVAEIKLRRYDAYAKVRALSAVFRDDSGATGVDGLLRDYAVRLNEASASIDRWLTGLYCTPTVRESSPCSSFDPGFDPYAEHLRIKEQVVALGNEGTDAVASRLVMQISGR